MAFIAVPKTLITRPGEPLGGSAETRSFKIPDVVPDWAKDVFLYVSIFNGTTPKPITVDEEDIEVSVSVGGAEYRQYIYVRPYSQDSFNTNSENMWFPMPPTRMVQVKTTAAIPEVHTGLRICVIGYRQ